MTNLNNFLIHKSKEDRILWLGCYLQAITTCHQQKQRASLEIEVGDSSDEAIKINVTDTSSLADENACIANLVDCLAKLYPRYDYYLNKVWDNYSPDYKRPSLKKIEQAVYKYRKIKKKSLNKCFIDNELFEISKCWDHFIVKQRELCNSSLDDLLGNLDNAINKGKILKDCKTTTVSIYKMTDGRKVIIKRYNSKGTFYSLTRSLIESRARACWHGALLLDQMGIDTPKNLAMIEKRVGPWIKNSYLITEYIEGKTLSSIFSEDSDKSEWLSIVHQITDILLTFPRVKVAHGDFKSTNFIVGNNKTFMVDLDSINSFTLSGIFKKSYLRDINRFEHNWAHSPSARNAFLPSIKKVRDLL